MKSEELYPGIRVYSEIFEDSTNIIKELREVYDWNAWYTFGDLCAVQIDRTTFKTFPSEQQWQDQIVSTLDKPNPSSIAILNAFYSATKDYVDVNQIDPVAWNFNSPAVCMYDTNAGVNEDIAMHYHTDFQQEKADSPGYKPYITCTMYLNGEYEGGELCFKILKDDGTSDEVTYKPNAGDVVVFPSNKPYYHAVNLTTKGQKYFVRSFWDYYFPGTPEWLENQAKHGPEKWAEMELAREKAERETGAYNLMSQN